ncbi:MAG: hypothetical protein AAB425_11360, partial [Bdellovibrionota bacterium]
AAHVGAALDLQSPKAKVVTRHRLDVDAEYLYLNSVENTENGEIGAGHLVDVEGVYNVELGRGKKVRPLVGAFGGYTFDTERFGQETPEFVEDDQTMTHSTAQVGIRAGASF